ncbi:hypothetical protein ANRL1_04687 [Anaerolineae bacterium]|nr:hypothetical protein ANRL1_04687 [Anaerolineae bacterium]
MDTMIVQVPEKIREHLEKRASSEGKTAQTVALEILARDLVPPEPAAPPAIYETEKEKYERVMKKLCEDGLIQPLSDELKGQIKNPATLEEAQEIMTRAGGKSLSQIVIEQRQERHDILVYGHQRARKKVRSRIRQPSSAKSNRRKRG